MRLSAGSGRFFQVLRCAFLAMLPCLAAACMTPDIALHRKSESVPPGYYVAVLPFSFQGNNPNPHGAEKILRRVFFNYFSYLSYRDLDPETVDRRLAAAGYTDPLTLQSVPPRELKRILGVDGVVFGQVLDTSNFTGGLYSETRIQADLQMLDLEDGNLVWELSHHEMEVSGIASPTLVEIIQDQIRNSQSESALVQSAESFSVKALAAIPEPHGAPAGRLPRIDRIQTNLPRHGALRPGDVLKVELFGQAGLKASFDIGSARTGVAMLEIAPGHYRGVYRVRSDDRFQQALIIGRLQNPQGLKRKMIYKSFSTRRET